MNVTTSRIPKQTHLYTAALGETAKRDATGKTTVRFRFSKKKVALKNRHELIKAAKIIHPLAHCRQTGLCSVPDLFVRPQVYFLSVGVRAYRNKTGGNRPHYQILLFGIFCLFSFRFVFHFIFVCFSLGLSERNFTTWHSAGYSRRSQRVWRGLFFESASEFTGIDEYVNDQVRRFIQMEGTGPHWGTTEHLVTAKRPLEQDKPIHGHRIKKNSPDLLDDWTRGSCTRMQDQLSLRPVNTPAKSKNSISLQWLRNLEATRVSLAGPRRKAPNDERPKRIKWVFVKHHLPLNKSKSTCASVRCSNNHKEKSGDLWPKTSQFLSKTHTH